MKILTLVLMNVFFLPTWDIDKKDGTIKNNPKDPKRLRDLTL